MGPSGSVMNNIYNLRCATCHRGIFIHPVTYHNHCHGKEVVSQVVQLLFFIAFVYIVDIFMHCECVLIPDNSKLVTYEFIAKGQILVSKSCFRSTFNKYHCVHGIMLKISHHTQYCTINNWYTHFCSPVLRQLFQWVGAQ